MRSRRSSFKPATAACRPWDDVHFCRPRQPVPQEPLSIAVDVTAPPCFRSGRRPAGALHATISAPAAARITRSTSSRTQADRIDGHPPDPPPPESVAADGRASSPPGDSVTTSLRRRLCFSQMRTIVLAAAIAPSELEIPNPASDFHLEMLRDAANASSALKCHGGRTVPLMPAPKGTATRE